MITVEFTDESIIINGVEIKAEIFDKDKSDYRLVQREEEIDNLIMWISECKHDRESDKVLMKEDLIFLLSIEDKYVFSSIKTNEFIAQSDDPTMFHDISLAILELNGMHREKATELLLPSENSEDSDKDYQECVICCCEQEFKNNTCTVCGNPQVDAITDKDAEIRRLTLENSLMEKAFLHIGFTLKEITDIRNGNDKPKAVISDNIIKSYVASIFLVDMKNGAKDYDDFMNNDSDLEIWSPFIEWSRGSIMDQMQDQYTHLRNSLEGVKFDTTHLTRDDFMEFWRSDAMSEELTVDDRLEIFVQAPVSASDITKEIINQIINDYEVQGLLVVDKNVNATS